MFYANLEYHRDELLYFALGNHPDLGYATVPPLIGWIAWVMQTIFGYSLFAVKFFPALLSGALVVVAAKIAKELGGVTYAQILTAIAIVFMPVGLRAFHLFQPVAIDLFLWTLLLYYTLRYINTEDKKYLITLGFVLGIALLNKYLIVLLTLAILIAWLIGTQRTIFKRSALYSSFAIALLIFSPNLIWQIINDFPVVGHMNALHENQLVYVDRFGFLMDQLLMTFSVCFIVVIGFIFLVRKRAYRYIAISTVIVLLTLYFLQGKSYYTMGLFPVLIAAGCVAIENGIKNKIVRIVVPIAIVLCTLPAFPIGLPVYPEEGLVEYFKKLEAKYGLEIGRRFEDGTIHSLPQDYADQLGWEELTAITNSVYKSIAEKEKVVIYAENYGQAGAIAVIGKKYDLPEPVSFHESFFYWAPKAYGPNIEYMIYINDEIGDDVRAAFENVELMGSISNVNAREYGTRVYLCSKPKIPFNELWQQARKRVTNPF
jgi:hypothetical protein